MPYPVRPVLTSYFLLMDGKDKYCFPGNDREQHRSALKILNIFIMVLQLFVYFHFRFPTSDQAEISNDGVVVRQV
ncbi:hypothetical protein UNH65_29385 [Chitinophaga sp. 180180018-2]|nr:hypothetical protein [Chitinophaga sp. 212800010-3]